MDLISKPSDVHVNAPLSNFAIDLPVEQGFLQDLVCPMVPVKKRSNSYFVFERVGAKSYNVDRGMGAEANEFKMALSDDSYSCKEKAIKTPIPFELLEEEDPGLELERGAVEDCVRILRIQRERRMATLVQTPANWDGDVAAAAAWNAPGADVESDINSATIAFMKQAGVLPNTIVISFQGYRDVISWLRAQSSSTSFRQYRELDFNMAAAGKIPELAGLFGISDWLVGMQLYDTAAIGDDYSGDFIWGNSATLMYLEQNVSFRTKCAAKTFLRHNFTVTTNVIAAKKSMDVEAFHVLDEKVVAKSLGYVITGTHA